MTSGSASPSRTDRYSTPARPAPSRGPIHHTYQFAKAPDATAGPNQRAGFMAAPVKGPPIRMSAATARPIAIPPSRGARRSSAVPKTAMTSRTVSTASMAMPVIGVTPWPRAGVPIAEGRHVSTLKIERSASPAASPPTSCAAT